MRLQLRDGPVTTIDLAPGDRILLQTEGHVSAEEAKSMQQQWDAAMKTSKVIVLPGHLRVVHIKGLMPWEKA